MNRTTKWFAAALMLLFFAVLVLLRREEGVIVGGPPLPPGKVSPQIEMTWDSAVVLAPDGTLWAWGGSSFGLRGVFSNATESVVPLRVGQDSDWARIGLGIHFITAVKQDGSLWGWGSNWEGALLSAPSNRVDQAWRLDKANDWMEVRAGAGHVMALKRDRSLWIWGKNDHGQIGDGTTNVCRKPLRLMTRSKWKSVSTGFFNSYAIADDGTLWGWGFSFRGASAGSDNLIPVEISPGTRWESISTGDYTLAAIRADGTLWVGGQNLSQLTSAKAGGGGTNLLLQIGSGTNWVDVWAGQGGFVARQKDGSWWASASSPAILLASSTGGAEDGSRLRRFNDNFNPLVMRAGMGTTAFMTDDGVLWTAGQRLGVRQKDNLMTEFRRVFFRLIGSPVPNRTETFVDLKPRAIWKLPAATGVDVER